MKTLTWLHLSDLHGCTPKYDWDAGRALAPTASPLDEAQRCADYILEEWFRTTR